MIDFASIPLSYSLPSKTPDLTEFRNSFRLLDDLPTFENLHVTFRVANGHSLIADYHFGDYLGDNEGEVYESTEEDEPCETTLAVFCPGGTVNLDATQPELIRHLFIQLTRTIKTIRTDLSEARIADFFWDAYAHDDSSNNNWPEWFRHLVKAAPVDPYGQCNVYEALNDKNDTQIPLFEDVLKKEKAAITRAVDRIVKAEKAMIDDNDEGSEWWCPEEGLFGFFCRRIEIPDDMREAAYTGLAEHCENPLREQVTCVKNDKQLRRAIGYLRAVDDLMTLCQTLP